MPRPDDDAIKQRTIGHMRAWLTGNYYPMGDHDRMVLRTAIELLEGKRPTDYPVPLPPGM